MQGKRVEVDMDLVKRLYVEEKKSLVACAEILGCSGSVIKNRLNIMNIQCRGKTEWARGYTFSKEHMEKLRQGRLGTHLSDEHKAKISATFKGKKLTEEHKRKIGDAHRGKKQPGKNQSGENNPNWNGGHAESWFEDSVIRSCYNIVRAAKLHGEIIKQPCEICGEKKAHAHHDDYRKPLKLRWLCRSHHMQFHNTHLLENYKYVKKDVT